MDEELYNQTGRKDGRMPHIPNQTCGGLRQTISALTVDINLTIADLQATRNDPGRVKQLTETLRTLTAYRRIVEEKFAFLKCGVSHRNIYVGLLGLDAVVVFSLDADGDAIPVKTISGPLTRLNQPSGLALDKDRNLYVANRGGGSITGYRPTARDNAAPFREIVGEATLLDEPYDVAVDTVGNVYAVTSDLNDG